MTDHTWHATEDELVLLFYGDTSADDEARLVAHVDSCAECGAVWHDLKASMAAVDAAAVPEPPADFERVIWARVQQALADTPAPVVRWWSPRYLVPASTFAAAALAVVVGTHYFASPIPDTSAPPSAVAAAGQSERALLVAMDTHLERSELLLTEFMNAPVTDATGLEFERTTADDLLLSSRLYRQTATQTGNGDLAAMLEDLERVLVEIARAPRELTERDLDTLRQRINDDDLIFKVRVITDEIRMRQAQMANVKEGDL